MDREFTEKDMRENRFWAALGYIVFFIPMVKIPKSRLGRYCANQGLILCIVTSLVSILFGILAGIPLLGWLFRVVGGLVSLALFCVGLLGLVQLTSVGRVMELPFVGMLTLLPELPLEEEEE